MKIERLQKSSLVEKLNDKEVAELNYTITQSRYFEEMNKTENKPHQSFQEENIENNKKKKAMKKVKS